MSSKKETLYDQMYRGPASRGTLVLEGLEEFEFFAVDFESGSMTSACRKVHLVRDVGPVKQISRFYRTHLFLGVFVEIHHPFAVEKKCCWSFCPIVACDLSQRCCIGAC